MEMCQNVTFLNAVKKIRSLFSRADVTEHEWRGHFDGCEHHLSFHIHTLTVLGPPWHHLYWNCFRSALDGRVTPKLDGVVQFWCPTPGTGTGYICGELLLTEQLEHLSLPDIKEVSVRNLTSFLRLTIVFTGQRDTFHYWWLFFTLCNSGTLLGLVTDKL